MDDTHSDTNDNGDGEGVWSPDIEHCFREALLLFPPCGRRKHILQEEGGKMYGRNELIARHIKMRTGKIRSRKQVSSHIQVLARRKAKAESGGHGGLELQDSIGSSSTGSASPANSIGLAPSSQISTNGGGGGGGLGGLSSSLTHTDIRSNQHLHHHHQSTQLQRTPSTYPCDIWNDRPIVTTKIRLVEFSAFIEHRPIAQHLPAIADFIKSSSNLGPITDLFLAANNYHGHQHQQQQQTNPADLTAITPNGAALQPGLHRPATLPADYEIDSQPRTPIMTTTTTINNNHNHHQLASSPHQQHQPLTPTSQFHHQFNQSLQINTTTTATPTANPYQTLPHNNTNGQAHQQQQQPLSNNQQHHQLMNQRNTEANNNLILSACASPMISSYHHHHHHHHSQQTTTPTSSGFTRHSYVKIDYRMPVFRHFDKLERIDIVQIQDKFPDIGGPDGLYQRGPSDAFFLIKFWADINNDFEYNIQDQNSYFGFSCHFETIEPLKNITVSTKACSYGLQVVEKVETIYGAFNSSNGRYSYDIDRSPMCEFMIQFIKKLRQLPRASQMNSVLENFTILQVITSETTSEILLCLAFVFEIASADQNNGSLYHVYKLTKD